MNRELKKHFAIAFLSLLFGMYCLIPQTAKAVVMRNITFLDGTESMTVSTTVPDDNQLGNLCKSQLQ